MKNSKFFAEFLKRLQDASCDGIMGVIPDGVETDSEAAKNAIVCILAMLGVDEQVTLTERFEGKALIYQIHLDVEATSGFKDLSDAKYVVNFFMHGELSDQMAADNAEAACNAAITWQTEEGFDYALVLRQEADGTRIEVLWCKWSNHDCGIRVDPNDPDYDVAAQAYADYMGD